MKKKIQVFLFVLVFALVISLVPPLYRHFNYGGVVPLSETYKTLSLVKDYPGFFSSAQPYFLNIYYLIVFWLPFKYLGVVISLLNVILLYVLLRRSNLDHFETYFSVLFFITSPVFTYGSTILSPDVFALTLLLVGFILLFYDYFYVGSIVLVLVPFVSFTAALVLLLSVLAFIAFRNYRQKYFLLLILILCLTAYNYYFLNSISLFTESRVNDFISDFGGIRGIGIFMIILSMVGVIASILKSKKELLVLLFFSVLLIFFFKVSPLTNIYLIIFLSYYSSFGLHYLINYKWSLETVKNWTYIVLFCGFLFSYLSYSKMISVSQPDSADVGSLKWLRENSIPGSVIFSHPAASYWIKYYTKLNPFIYEDSPDLMVKQKDIDTIYFSRVLQNTTGILKNNNITYIWLDPDTKKNIFLKEDQGLLFLFSNNETFTKIYETNNISVWTVNLGETS